MIAVYGYAYFVINQLYCSEQLLCIFQMLLNRIKLEYKYKQDKPISQLFISIIVIL